LAVARVALMLAPPLAKKGGPVKWAAFFIAGDARFVSAQEEVTPRL